MRRPKGLKYKIKVVNRAWFKKGESPYPAPKGTHRSPGTEIRKGQRLSPETEFKKGVVTHNFKGDDVGYFALHAWVRRHFGDQEECEKCHCKGRMQWANVSYEYRRERSDWMALCQQCHSKHDYENGWGLASEKFPELRKCVS